MTLNPQAAAFIELAASAPPLSDDPIERLRLGSAAMSARLADPEQVASIADIRIPASSGGLPARIYTPETTGSLAIVLYHGGGWVLGDLDMVDTLATRLANAAAAVVVSVDYRLAPEHRFPAAVDDAEEAYAWIAAHRAELGIGGAGLVVAGDSAGGNLAAVVAASTRDPWARPVGQVLFYPVTDHDFDRASYRENAEGYYLSAAGMRFFWDAYVPDPSAREDPRVSPLRASSFAHLPPSLVVTAEYDPLRDEGVAYAERLAADGVPVEAYTYPGQIHSFVTRIGFIDDAADAVRRAAAFVRGLA